MSATETTLGGHQDRFPETTWSRILSQPDPESPERRERLNRLLADYWRPVYRFIRATWRKSNEDAKDLTQEFFCRLLDGDFFERYDPGRGRFRTFLKDALRKFLAKEHRDGARERRGGGRAVVSLDTAEVDRDEALVDGQSGAPEDLFDRQWALDVTRRSLERLRASLAAEGKQVYFAVYEAYDLWPGTGERPTYEAVARANAVSVNDVKNYLDLARIRLQQQVVECVSEYVASHDLVSREISELFP